MDPNATLAEILGLIKDRDYPEWANEYGDDLAEKVENLHNWITSGGFLPKAWERN